MINLGHLRQRGCFLALEQHFEQLLLRQRVKLLEVRDEVLHLRLLGGVVTAAVAVLGGSGALDGTVRVVLS